VTYKVARISTVPFFVKTQLSSQIRYLDESGFDVSVVCSDGDIGELNVNFFPLKINREILIWEDVTACFQLYKLFRKERFDIIHSTTPKAGLLCAIAGFLARTPVRLHTFTGQTWANSSGLKKKFFKLIDWLIVKLNTHVYADSHSQRKYLMANGVAREDEITCLGSGSLAGVDLDRFKDENVSGLSLCKQKYQITDKSFVFLFLGRVSTDKGVKELISAFQKVSDEHENAVLLVVGPLEENSINVKDYSNSIKFVGYSDLPENFIAIADILVLPSYREGFGTTVIEAAAMSKPAIGSDIYGLNDAIVDNETGILVPPRDIDELYQAMQFVISDKNELKRLGENAKMRAEKEFSSEHMSRLVANEYRYFMGKFCK
jgi:glycosyltransferase involved in cell wall biosynthesis